MSANELAAEQLLDRLHQEDQTVGVIFEALEIVVLVEGTRSIVLCIDNYADRSNLCAQLKAPSQPVLQGLQNRLRVPRNDAQQDRGRRIRAPRSPLPIPHRP